MNREKKIKPSWDEGDIFSNKARQIDGPGPDVIKLQKKRYRKRFRRETKEELKDWEGRVE